MLVVVGLNRVGRGKGVESHKKDHGEDQSSGIAAQPTQNTPTPTGFAATDENVDCGNQRQNRQKQKEGLVDHQPVGLKSGPDQNKKHDQGCAQRDGQKWVGDFLQHVRNILFPSLQ